MRLCIRRKNWNVSHTITNWNNLTAWCFVSIMRKMVSAPIAAARKCRRSTSLTKSNLRLVLS